MVKDIRMSILSKTRGQTAESLSRVFENLGGKIHVTFMGGYKYPIIVRDDYSRYASISFATI